MTIDEAIEFYKGYKDRSGGTVDYNEFDEQMVKWLEELKKHKEKPEGYLWDEAVQQGYNKAIDDFVKSFKNLIEDELLNPILMSECKKLGVWKNYDFEKMAEQLKEGAGIGTDNQ